MAEDKRLNKAAKEYNISTDRVVEFLKSKGHTIEDVNPNTKIPANLIVLLDKEFGSDKKSRETSKEITEEQRKEKEAIKQELLEKERKEKERLQKEQEIIRAKASVPGAKIVGKIDLDQPKKEAPKETLAPSAEEPAPIVSIEKNSQAKVEQSAHEEHPDKHEKNKDKHNQFRS